MLFKATLFLYIMKMVSKSRLTLSFSYEKTDWVFFKKKNLAFRLWGLKLFWVDIWAPQRECPGTSSHNEKRRKIGLAASCLRFYSVKSTCKTALKINLSENYPSYFHNFRKTHGPVDIPLRNSILRVIECSTVWNLVKLSEALGSNGLMNHR